MILKWELNYTLCGLKYFNPDLRYTTQYKYRFVYTKLLTNTAESILNVLYTCACLIAAGVPNNYFFDCHLYFTVFITNVRILVIFL